MVRRLSFFILAALFLSFINHTYYVSITEVNFNEKNNSFEMSIKFIGHDLEKAMEKSGVPDLFLGTDRENDKTNEHIEKYLRERLRFVVNEKRLSYKIIGKEVRDDDFIYCYIVSEKATNPKRIEIENTLLTEVFSEQNNIIYLEINGNKVNYSLNKSHDREVYEIE